MRAPNKIPPLSVMLDDIDDVKALARRIGVTYPLFAKYAEKDSAPRSVLLAVFWETQWGMSILHADYENETMYLRQLVGALERNLAESRRQVLLLEAQLQDRVYFAQNSPIAKIA